MPALKTSVLTMYDYLKGHVESLSPTEAVIECAGIGFNILISLQTYEALSGKSEAKVYVHHYLREDDEQFFGFATKGERELFKLLITVSGVGVGSARMMLLSMGDDEIREAIIAENVHKIKSIKGVGIKTAQRIILDLKDKIIKGAGSEQVSIVPSSNNVAAEEAATALVLLGFTRANVNKVLPEIIKTNPNAKVEDIIKAALQKL